MIGLYKCPACTNTETPFKEGPHLFICNFCGCMYSMIPQTRAGVEGIMIVVYETSYKDWIAGHEG